MMVTPDWFEKQNDNDDPFTANADGFDMDNDEMNCLFAYHEGMRGTGRAGHADMVGRSRPDTGWLTPTSATGSVPLTMRGKWRRTFPLLLHPRRLRLQLRQGADYPERAELLLPRGGRCG